MNRDLGDLYRDPQFEDKRLASHHRYFSLRENERAAFKSKIGPVESDRVAKEVQRIDSIRARLESGEKYGEKKVLEDLRDAHKAWRKEAHDNVAKYEKAVRKGGQGPAKARYGRKKEHEDPEKREERLKRELKNKPRNLEILRRVGEWTIEDDPVTANGQPGTDTSTAKEHTIITTEHHEASSSTSTTTVNPRITNGHHEASPSNSVPITAAANPATEAPPAKQDDGHGPDFRSYAMYFKESDSEGGYVGETYRGSDWLDRNSKFPNQRVSALRLLELQDKKPEAEEKKKNPLRQRHKDDKYLRWFHFPTNNMAWIEDAIARYYDEDTVPHDDLKSRSDMSRAEHLLCREYWRGQMHGGSGNVPIHARHMRPRCSIIPRPPDPKAHTDPKAPPESPATTRSRKAKANNVALFLPYLHWEMDAKRAHMAEIIKKEGIVHTEEEEKAWQARLPPPPGRSKLGTYLMHAARATVIIDLEPDTRLTRKYLHHKPPLHIRRTLDQYYFLTLDDTSKRDRDQVVYRATNWGLKRPSRNARVVMVDQLWLWILDDNTIITSFPRRWGRNKPDSSGVHKCLRERLHAMKSIDSIHHLALIIIEQCSKVFFDRTKPLDQRPEVIDMFLSAIGNITEQTSIAHDTFWKNTTMLASGIFPANTRSKYLNINPEGTLLREARDTAEELGIMQRVFKDQQHVVRDYRRYLMRQKGDSHQESDMVAVLKNFVVLASRDKDKEKIEANVADKEQQAEESMSFWDEAAREADVLLELIENHQAEIRELEESATRNCQQLEGLLSLKQQQAGIVEARESIKQGRTIMAFTLVTIFFLPLGFFAAVFGMNNAQSTDNGWMTLRQQMSYMFGLSTLVTVVVLAMSFSEWVNALLNLLVRAPILWLAERFWLRLAWQVARVDQATLERSSERVLRNVVDMREERDRNRRGDRWRELDRHLKKRAAKKKAEHHPPGDEYSAVEKGQGVRNRGHR